MMKSGFSFILILLLVFNILTLSCATYNTPLTDGIERFDVVKIEDLVIVNLQHEEIVKFSFQGFQHNFNVFLTEANHFGHDADLHTHEEDEDVVHMTSLREGSVKTTNGVKGKASFVVEKTKITETHRIASGVLSMMSDKETYYLEPLADYLPGGEKAEVAKEEAKKLLLGLYSSQQKTIEEGEEKKNNKHETGETLLLEGADEGMEISEAENHADNTLSTNSEEEVKDQRVERVKETEKLYVIYRWRDVSVDELKCGVVGRPEKEVLDHVSKYYKNHPHDTTLFRHGNHTHKRGKRTIEETEQTAQFSTNTLVAPIAVHIDCNYHAELKKRNVNPYVQALVIFAKGSALFEEQMNVKLAVIRIVVHQNCGTPSFNQQCGQSIETHLNDFGRWRKNQTYDQDAAAWHLLTNCYAPTSKTPIPVGLAYEQTACSSSSNGLSSQVGEQSWMTTAHEIGHNFGAPHDECDTENCACKDCNCGGKFLMAATHSARISAKFSSCSLQIMNSYMSSFTCLKGTNQRVMKRTDTPICGNGIWEPTEECDCGRSCGNDNCCNNECKLKNGAKCSDANSACCQNCQVVTDKKKKCHEINPSNDCDTEDFCDGVSAICPDKGKPDQTPCTRNSKNGICLSNVCTSRDLQCNDAGMGLGSPLAECNWRKFNYEQCTLWCGDPSDNSKSCFGSFDGIPVPPVVNGMQCKTNNGMEGVCYERKCLLPQNVPSPTPYSLPKPPAAAPTPAPAPAPAPTPAPPAVAPTPEGDTENTPAPTPKGKKTVPPKTTALPTASEGNPTTRVTGNTSAALPATIGWLMLSVLILITSLVFLL